MADPPCMKAILGSEGVILGRGTFCLGSTRHQAGLAVRGWFRAGVRAVRWALVAFAFLLFSEGPVEGSSRLHLIAWHDAFAPVIHVIAPNVAPDSEGVSV